jgi:hypothetical protein
MKQLLQSIKDNDFFPSSSFLGYITGLTSNNEDDYYDILLPIATPIEKS